MWKAGVFEEGTMLADVIHPPAEQLPLRSPSGGDPNLVHACLRCGVEVERFGLGTSGLCRHTRAPRTCDLPGTRERKEGMSSPIAAQILDFWDQKLFRETFQHSEVSSCSGSCYEENSNITDLSFSSFPSDMANFADPVTTTTNNNNNHSIILDSPHDTISLNFSSPQPTTIPTFLGSSGSLQHDQFDFSSLQSQISSNNTVNVNVFSPRSPDSLVPIGMPPPLLPVFEEDCLLSMPTYPRMDASSPSSCSFLDHSGMPGLMIESLNGGVSEETSGMFSGSIIGESGLQGQELAYHGENGGMYASDSVYSSGDMQVLSDNQQHMVKGCGSPAPLTSDMSSLEDPSSKPGRLSVEERKEKIHRYMRKRNERNFSKKIKYACRKTLADSRPRVRGRFAKNDGFGEATRPSSYNHEDDDDEVTVKEEDEMIDSSDIFAHIVE